MFSASVLKSALRMKCWVCRCLSQTITTVWLAFTTWSLTPATAQQALLFAGDVARAMPRKTVDLSSELRYRMIFNIVLEKQHFESGLSSYVLEDFSPRPTMPREIAELSGMMIAATSGFMWPSRAKVIAVAL